MFLKPPPPVDLERPRSEVFVRMITYAPSQLDMHRIKQQQEKEEKAAEQPAVEPQLPEVAEQLPEDS